MGIYLALVDNDEAFCRSAVTPIIINDINTSTEDEKSYVDRLISTRYDTDLLSNEPSCECGDLTGGYNLGTMCPNCRTTVKELFDQELQSLVWLRSPRGVEKLINPMVLTQLSQKFTKAKFNIIEWLCNTDYHPAIPKPPVLDELIELGVVRGYNNFVINFKTYMDILFNLKVFKPKKEKEEFLYQHLQENSHLIFSWHLPLPNKSILVIEDTQVGVFVDSIVVDAIDAIRTICSIDTPLATFTQKQRENRTAKTLFILANFCNEVNHEILASKNGLFRKHVFGSRCYFSTRAVISSNTMKHEYDGLYIPWGAGITMLKIHLMNKLAKLNYTANEANAIMQKAIYTYDPLLDQLFKEIFDETPDKCLYCIYGRN